VAHSVGGAATLFATRLGFTAARFAVIAAPTSPASFATHFARRLALGEDVKREMIARLEARYDVAFSEIDARIDAARLRAPLLVVHDAEDPVVDLDNGRVLARTARNGTLVETVGLGHRAILRAPRVVETVTRFVAEGVAPRTFTETLEGELFVRDTRW
jgi:pimeloyl-ACP methyl ester carboxylesterase